jgi:phosphohistidine swiveling domain-containing protein
VNKLKDKFKKNFNEIFDFIFLPEKMTAIGEEKFELLNLAKKCIKKKRILKKDLKNHFLKYAFVNKYYFWGQGYTLKEMEKRLKELIKKGLLYIEKEIKKIKSEIKKDILVKYRFNEYEKKIIKSMKKASYAMNFADEATNYYTYHLKGLFNEIARRLKLSYEEVVSLRLSEIIESLEKNKLVVSRKEVAERVKDHAIIFINGYSKVLSGKKLKKYYQEEKAEETTIKIVKFKGIVVYQGGIIKGKVRIIKKPEEIPKFQKGEILVTPMTNPTYLPAIQKSSAIITDEGGLLCHAAIVSRELKIPCIIGTKIATKVLKDGDLVEVDANKGVIRKIK